MIDYDLEIQNLSGYDWVEDLLTTKEEFFTEEDIKSLIDELK